MKGFVRWVEGSSLWGLASVPVRLKQAQLPRGGDSDLRNTALCNYMKHEFHCDKWRLKDLAN